MAGPLVIWNWELYTADAQLLALVFIGGFWGVHQDPAQKETKLKVSKRKGRNKRIRESEEKNQCNWFLETF